MIDPPYGQSCSVYDMIVFSPLKSTLEDCKLAGCQGYSGAVVLAVAQGVLCGEDPVIHVSVQHLPHLSQGLLLVDQNGPQTG